MKNDAIKTAIADATQDTGFTQAFPGRVSIHAVAMALLANEDAESMAGARGMILDAIMAGEVIPARCDMPYAFPGFKTALELSAMVHPTQGSCVWHMIRVS